MSIILGINSYHPGASAALIIDGQIVYAIAEERLNRIKYFGGFPAMAIQACLDHAGIDASQIDHVALGRDSSANRAKKIEYTLKNPLLLGNLLKIKAARDVLDDLKTLISKQCGIDRDALRFQEHDIEHHLAHTASAYFISNWDDAAGITIDGSGDFVTCMMSRCEGNTITPVHRIYVPHSLGSFYTMICQFIGYDRYGDEGKVMGLAPLGSEVYRDTFAKMVHYQDSNIMLNPEYFLPFGKNQGMVVNDDGTATLARMYSDLMVETFGEPRKRGAEITQRDMDMAFCLQQRFEVIYFDLLNDLYDRVPNPRLAMAGGCALNSVANGKLFDTTSFEETSIQPAAGDEGLALGAALYVSRCVLNEQTGPIEFSSYLGSCPEDDSVQKSLEARGLTYRKLDRAELLETTAEHIANGKVVGWFQGRSEWGPRALGNRSILCHPGYPGMKDILNARIKHREAFRPFAPVVLAERQSEIFDNDYPSPYMLHVYKIREEWRSRLAAVTHVDDTGRIQTVAREENPLYYDLISAFAARTGTPVLLNTSFNENEPIVENADEAIDCFMRTKMDIIVAGSFIVEKASSAS